MEGERPLVVTEEYERLGGKKLSLIDVLAQSVGFIGPGVQRGVHHPADHRRERGRQGRRHLRRPGRAVGGRRHVRDRLDRGPVREAHPCRGIALRLRVERPGQDRRRGDGLAVLRRHDHPDDGARRPDRRVRARQPPAGVGDRPRSADLAVGRVLRAPPVRGAVLRGQDLDARAAHAGADLDRGGADLLHHGDRGPGRATTTSRRRSTRRRHPMGSPGSCSGCCTAC